METTNRSRKRTHHGHAIKRLRKSLGIKQEALAADLDITQQAISLYEQKPVIEDDMLLKIAEILKVPVDLIKEAEEDPLTIIIENNIFQNGSSVGTIGKVDGNSIINNNPIEKVLELSNEKMALYERILELEREKNALLQSLLKKE